MEFAGGGADAGGAKPTRLLRCSSVRILLASPTALTKAKRPSPRSFSISRIFDD